MYKCILHDSTLKFWLIVMIINKRQEYIARIWKIQLDICLFYENSVRIQLEYNKSWGYVLDICLICLLYKLLYLIKMHSVLTKLKNSAILNMVAEIP